MACPCGNTRINSGLDNATVYPCKDCAATNSCVSKFQSNYLKRPNLESYKQDIVKHYKCSRQLQVQPFTVRGDTNAQRSSDFIALQCRALAKLAELIDNFSLHPCKTVFTGLYFLAIDSQNSYCETYCGNFDIDRFEEALSGDFGDEENSHTETPGIPAYIATSLPIHRPTMLLLLLYIVKHLRSTFRCDVVVEYNCFYSARLTVARQNIFPLWRVNTAYPTIYIESLDLRICLKTLCCPAFRACDNWLDVADVFLLHNCFDLEVRHFIVSPDLKLAYDRSTFPLTRKCSLDTDLAFRLHWAELCRTQNQKLVTRLVFLFLEKKRLQAAKDICAEADPYPHFRPLFSWQFIETVNCYTSDRNVKHQVVCDKASAPFTDFKLCQMDCLQELGQSEAASLGVTYTLHYNINSYQSGDIATYLIDANAGNDNKAGLEYLWILNKQDLFCPDPAEPHFEIDYHKMEVSRGYIWQPTVIACLADFHHAMNTLKLVCRDCYERGELLIVIRSALVSKS